MRIKEIQTPTGLARVHVHRAKHPVGSLVLSHGAGGGIGAPDLVMLDQVVERGWTYALVEQPWRVAGKKLAPPPKTLDAAWVPILAELAQGRWALPGPLVVGGRSAGARVACRTAKTVGAHAVLALAFPLHPPGNPAKSRAEEANAAVADGIRVVVVQGERDPFGGPDEVRAALNPRIEVMAVKGDHSFTKNPQDVVTASLAWLTRVASSA